jgi:hypothetical protein
MDKQPSFRERIEGLEAACKYLDEIAATIATEVERMRAAEKRFSERRSSAKEKASR